jgi:hypothetical protein
VLTDTQPVADQVGRLRHADDDANRDAGKALGASC